MTPQDATFAKILVHNKLVEAPKLQQAQQEFEQSGSGTLADFLVAKGLITPQVKSAVEKALAKQTPQPAGGSDEEPKSSESQRLVEARTKLKWKPRSQRMAKVVMAAQADEDEDEAISGTSGFSLGNGHDRLDNVDRFIRHILPTRDHQRILQWILDNHQSIISEEDMVNKIRSVDKELAGNVCARWLKEGLLRKVGVRTYNVSPSRTMSRQINTFMAAWKDRSTHPLLMQKLMAVEQRQPK